MSINALLRQKRSTTVICYHMQRLILPLQPPVAQQHSSSIFEPDYLETGKSKIPLYNTLNIQLKGYDFPVLESYQGFVHKIAEAMGIEVANGWATPPQHQQVQRFKPHSTIVDTEYKMTIYERNVQVVDLPSTIGSVFFEVLHTTLPEGLSMTVHEHKEEHEEVRYVPDIQLLELKTQLEDLGRPLKKK